MPTTTSTTSSTAAATSSSATSQPSSARSLKLKEQSKQFEAVMIGEMLKSMRKTVPEGQGWFNQSSAQKTMRDMFDQRLSDVLAQRGVLGVAPQIYRAMAAKAALGDSPAPAVGPTPPLAARA